LSDIRKDQDTIAVTVAVLERLYDFRPDGSGGFVGFYFINVELYKRYEMKRLHEEPGKTYLYELNEITWEHIVYIYLITWSVVR
jgi:hypothetical protein